MSTTLLIARIEYTYTKRLRRKESAENALKTVITPAPAMATVYPPTPAAAVKAAAATVERATLPATSRSTHIRPRAITQPDGRDSRNVSMEKLPIAAPRDALTTHAVNRPRCAAGRPTDTSAAAPASARAPR